MMNTYKALSNHLPINNDLFIASFPHDCSIKAIIHSATYFSIPPPPTASATFRIPDERRCLLSLSLVFYPGLKVNIYDSSIKIKFSQYSLCGPIVLGYQFLSLEYDTSFLETFSQHVRTIPSLLNKNWYTAGYQELFTAKGTSEGLSNPAWGILSSDASTLTLASEGTLGTPPGLPCTIPVCVLLDLQEPPPPVLTTSITVSARLEEKGSKIRSLFRHFRRHKVKFPSVAICHGPRLPVLQGDKGVARRSHDTRRGSQASATSREQSGPASPTSIASIPHFSRINSYGQSPPASPITPIRPARPCPLLPEATNVQVDIPQFSDLTLSDLQILPVASRPAPLPTITLTDYSVKIVNKGKAKDINFAQVISKAELRDLVATLDFRPKDPISLSVTELRAQNMLFAAQSLVIRFLMEEPKYEQPGLDSYGEGALLRAMQDKIDSAIIMELGTSWAAIRMTINNIFSKARALKEVERQIEELNEPLVEKRYTSTSSVASMASASSSQAMIKLDDSPVDPLMSLSAAPPSNLLKRRRQAVRVAAARQRVRWASDANRALGAVEEEVLEKCV